MPRKCAFILAATDAGPMILNRFDRADTPNGSFGVGHVLLENSVYDPDEVTQLAKILALKRKYSNEDVLFLDAGANIGTYTVPIAKAITGWGKAIAIEPQEHLFYALCGNVALNNVLNVNCQRIALGSEDSTLNIPVLDSLSYASFGSLELIDTGVPEHMGQEVNRNAERLEEISLKRIDTIIKDRIDLIKMDIEGMEMAALKGAERVLNEQMPVLFIEWTKSNREELVSFLEDHGYFIKGAGVNLLAVHLDDRVLNHIK